MPLHGDRIPQPPSGVTGPVGEWMRQVARQLNSEGYISVFSGTNPNTSGVTGLPGNLLINIGSASSNSRLFVMGGSTRSSDTNNWFTIRIATP